MTKKFVLLLAVLFGISSCSYRFACAQTLRSDQRALTDMAGRTVVVPKKIHSVLGMSPVGTVLVYTLSPELLAGWNYQPDPENWPSIRSRTGICPCSAAGMGRIVPAIWRRSFRRILTF